MPGLILCRNKDVDTAWYVLQVGGDCFAQLWIEDV